jgi:hypothetical protein
MSPRAAHVGLRHSWMLIALLRVGGYVDVATVELDGR